MTRTFTTCSGANSNRFCERLVHIRTFSAKFSPAAGGMLQVNYANALKERMKKAQRWLGTEFTVRASYVALRNAIAMGIRVILSTEIAPATTAATTPIKNACSITAGTGRIRAI